MPSFGQKRIAKIAPALLAAVLLLGSWYTFFATGGLVELPKNEKPELGVRLDPPTLVQDSTQLVRVGGSTTQPCTVILEVNTFPYGHQETGPDNGFEFKNVILGPGVNSVVVKAVQLEGLRRYEAKTEVPVDLEPEPASGPDSAFGVLYYKGQMPVPVRRSATAEVSYRQIKVRTEAALRREDKRIELIRDTDNNDIPKEQRYHHFVQEVFHDMRVGGVLVAENCRPDSEPRPDALMTVTATCTLPPRNVFKEAFNQTLDIATDWRVNSEGEDRFTLKVDDYALVIPDPKCVTKREGDNVAYWVRGGLGADPSCKAKVRLEYRPGASVWNILRVLRTSLYQLVPPKFPRLFALLLFASGVLLAIPLVWGLWVVKRSHDESGFGAVSVERVKRGASWLLPLLFVPSVLYGANTVSAVIANGQAPNVLTRLAAFLLSSEEGKLSSVDLRVYLIALLLIASVGGALLLLTRWKFKDAPPVYWARAVLRAACVAMLASLFLVVAVGFAMSRLPSNLVNLPHILSWLCVWLVLVVMSECAARLAPPTFAGGVLSKWWGRVLLTPLLLLVATPSGLLDLYGGKVFTSAPHVTVFNWVGDGVTLASRLVPYVFLLGLASMLKGAGRKGGGDERAFKPGAILFAAYVVSSTLQMMMIPLATVAAFFVYKHRLFVEEAWRARLRGVRAGVHQERKSWANRVLKLLDVYEAESILAEFRKKSRKADITGTELAERRGEADATIAEAKPLVVIEGGLRVDDVFLAVGPGGSDWGDGVHAAKFGFWFSLPLLVVYLSGVLPPPVPPYGGQFAVLEFFTRGAAFISYWVAAAFFFGYFFMYVEGKTGLWKGVWLSLLVVACAMLSDLDLKERLFYAGSHLLFFGLLGALRFDYEIAKETLKDKFGWGKFFQLEIGRTLSPNSLVVVILVSFATTAALNGLGYLLNKLTSVFA